MGLYVEPLGKLQMHNSAVNQTVYLLNVVQHALIQNAASLKLTKSQYSVAGLDCISGALQQAVQATELQT